MITFCYHSILHCDISNIDFHTWLKNCYTEVYWNRCDCFIEWKICDSDINKHWIHNKLASVNTKWKHIFSKTYPNGIAESALTQQLATVVLHVSCTFIRLNIYWMANVTRSTWSLCIQINGTHFERTRLSVEHRKSIANKKHRLLLSVLQFALKLDWIVWLHSVQILLNRTSSLKRQQQKARQIHCRSSTKCQIEYKNSIIEYSVLSLISQLRIDFI